MIVLKANEELKSVFGRMVKTMGVNVVWTGRFVILNNFLIMAGNVRSLIFNFDNRKVNTNVIELPDREEDAEPIGNNEILTNVLNMTLYAFGKWGTIKGLKVEQDYNQLDELFQAILKDIKVTPGFRDDYFRFYKEKIQMTYEEVVEAAIEEGKRKAQEAKSDEEEAQAEKGLGLWHKICWKVEQCNFSRSELSAYEKHAARLGNNFYRAPLHCPKCSEKLFMVVYPEGEENPVETEEGKVYLARSYTCNTCNAFYTPRPGKLLQEGDVYTLDFEGDRDAYEDYRKLLGKTGQRTTNYHFNEYEWERGKTRDPETIEEACANLEEMTEEELLELDGKLQEDFFPPEKAKPYRKRIQNLLRKFEQKKEKDPKGAEENNAPKEHFQSQEKNRNQNGKISDSNLVSKDGNSRNEELRGAKGERQNRPEDADRPAHRAGEPHKDSHAGDEVWEKYQARMQVLERMSPRQLQDLRRQLQSEKSLSSDEKKEFGAQIDMAEARREEEGIRQKIRDCEGKSYSVLTRLEADVAKAKTSEAAKGELLEQIREMKRVRGQQEASQLLASMPANMTRNQYRAFRDKLAQYEEVDLSSYEDELEARGRQAEKAELDAMARRLTKSDRKGLMNMLQQLKEGFSQEHAAPIKAQIEDRIRKLDEAAIEKICPDIFSMSFDEAAEAYEKIEGGPFLPEIKTNTLGMIDKRLTKIKMDECALLVEKLRGDLKGRIKDMERLHFYEARKVMHGDWEEDEAKLAARAMNTYAADRSRYEYPILICDSSAKKNGREGFLLTPDHIFYNSAFNSEKIPIRGVYGVEGNTGLLNRGIYIKRGNGIKTKIPGGIPAKELDVFGKILDGFVSYLQEKPESRSISYLAKEQHEIKCCYRCGYTYQGGTVCPKCGNQANH